jgi:hypothetical protein
MDCKLPKSFSERVQPQTGAGSELPPMFAGPAPYFANALLGAMAQHLLYYIENYETNLLFNGSAYCGAGLEL